MTPDHPTAHQPDGADASSAFDAGIADANTLPGGGAPDATSGIGGAHQADGTDVSASLEAGIADEGTIPG